MSQSAGGTAADQRLLSVGAALPAAAGNAAASFKASHSVRLVLRYLPRRPDLPLGGDFRLVCSGADPAHPPCGAHLAAVPGGRCPSAKMPPAFFWTPGADSFGFWLLTPVKRYGITATRVRMAVPLGGERTESVGGAAEDACADASCFRPAPQRPAWRKSWNRRGSGPAFIRIRSGREATESGRRHSAGPGFPYAAQPAFLIVPVWSAFAPHRSIADL